MRPFILLLLCLPLLAVDQIELELPKSWRGKKGDSSEGNPAAAKGMPPVWRFDSIWPANPAEGSAYSPMVWDAKRELWYRTKGDNHGGYPTAKLDDSGNIVISSSGAWTGTETNKMAALVLVAPTGATYGLAADVTLKRHTGDGHFILLAYKRDADRATPRVTELKKVTLNPDKTERLEIVTELAAGEELCLVPRSTAYHTAGAITFRKLSAVVRR